MNFRTFLARRRDRAGFLLLVAGVVFASGLGAQTAPASPKLRAETTEKLTARREALLAFKGGDAAAAVLKLTSVARKYSKAATPEEFSVGKMLADVSFGLHNESSPAAATAAQLALSRLNSVQTGLSMRDAATALVTMGALYEHVQGDLVQARAAYQRALTRNPESREAKERLARLGAVESAANAKAAANALLAQRRAAKGTP